MSFDVEGRGHFASSADAQPRGAVSATLLVAMVAPCFHLKSAMGCALAGVGSLSGHGSGVDVPESDSSLYANAGARLGVELPLVGPVSARLLGDLLIPVVATRTARARRTGPAERRKTVASSLRAMKMALSLAVMLASPSARAQPSAADKHLARSLMDRGDRFMEAKSYAEALDVYARAHAIMRVPTTAIEVARAQAALGHVVKAREAALEAARSPSADGEPAVFEEARAEAAKLAGELTQRAGSISVEVIVADAFAIVTVDGLDAPANEPVAVDPGAHVVRVVAPAYSPMSRDVNVGQGEAARVSFTLAHENRSSNHRPLVLGGFVAGGAGVAAGALFGAMSLSRASSARDQCAGNRCPPQARGDIDAAKSLALASDVAFVIGVAGLALGGYGVWAQARERPEPAAPASGRVRVSPVLGVASVALKADF